MEDILFTDGDLTYCCELSPVCPQTGQDVMQYDAHGGEVLYKAWAINCHCDEHNGFHIKSHGIVYMSCLSLFSINRHKEIWFRWKGTSERFAKAKASKNASQIASIDVLASSGAAPAPVQPQVPLQLPAATSGPAPVPVQPQVHCRLQACSEPSPWERTNQYLIAQLMVKLPLHQNRYSTCNMCNPVRGIIMALKSQQVLLVD